MIYASKHQQMSEETSPEDSVFYDLSSIERLPCLNEEASDESLDGIREDQPEEAKSFDPAWVGMLQKDRPEYSIQKVLELPMPSSFLSNTPAASSKGFPEDSPGGFSVDLLDSYDSEEESDALTEDSDALTEDSDGALPLLGQ